MRVLHGKGDKARTIGLEPGAFAVLERWLDRMAVKGIKWKAPLFCTLKGDPIHSLCEDSSAAHSREGRHREGNGGCGG